MVLTHFSQRYPVPTALCKAPLPGQRDVEGGDKDERGDYGRSPKRKRLPAAAASLTTDAPRGSHEHGSRQPGAHGLGNKLILKAQDHLEVRDLVNLINAVAESEASVSEASVPKRFGFDSNTLGSRKKHIASGNKLKRLNKLREASEYLDRYFTWVASEVSEEGEEPKDL